jgi:hypothetical protein
VKKKRVKLAQTTQPHLNGLKTMQDSSIYWHHSQSRRITKGPIINNFVVDSQEASNDGPEISTW